MKKTNYLKLLGPATLLITLQAWAHDPAEHKQDAEKPDCAAMKNMDHSKMDMNDPVMQAKMMKCMHHMHSGQKVKEQDESASTTEHHHEK